MIEIHCYDVQKYPDSARQKLIREFMECMMWSEGCEKERYTNVYIGLVNGYNLIYDDGRYFNVKEKKKKTFYYIKKVNGKKYIAFTDLDSARAYAIKLLKSGTGNLFYRDKWEVVIDDSPELLGNNPGFVSYLSRSGRYRYMTRDANNNNVFTLLNDDGTAATPKKKKTVKKTPAPFGL